MQDARYWISAETPAQDSVRPSSIKYPESRITYLALNTKRAITNLLKSNISFRLYKAYILDSIFIVKNHGFKELLKRKGLKFLIIIELYYLVRDTILYIIMSFLIARGIIK